jgi:hypothetical protein
MQRSTTSFVAALLSLVLTASFFPPAAALAAPVRTAPVGLPFDPAPLGGRCGDPSGSWLGMPWSEVVRWRFNPSTVPEYLVSGSSRTAVLASVTSAVHAVSTGANDCGLPADLDLQQRYVGTTTKTANIDSAGHCQSRDRVNVVSFGRLPMGLLAVTCVWWEGGSGRTHSVEADIVIDSNAGTFFLNPPPGCLGQWDLESILTHEFGHVFGLGHVSFAEHRTLTMSDSLPDCSTDYRTLGLGDYLTLSGHYRAQKD